MSGPGPETGLPVPPAGHFRVLIVEDNALLARMVLEVMRKSGFVTAAAVNGLEALEAIATAVEERQPFDLVLMDIDMPVMDGNQATRRVREDARFVHLPVIALTAYDEKDTLEELEAAGFSDYVTKPFQPRDLVNKALFWVQEGRDHQKAAGLAKPADTAGAEKNGPARPEKVTIAIEDDPTQGMEMPDLPDLAVRSGLARIGGGPDLYLRLLERFRENYRDVPVRLLAAVEHGNWKDAERLAHSMNGLSGSIGANRLHQAAMTLERRLRHRDADAETASPVGLKSREVLDFVAAHESIVQGLDLFFADRDEKRRAARDQESDHPDGETEAGGDGTSKRGNVIGNPLEVAVWVEEVTGLVNEDYVAARDRAEALVSRLEGSDLAADSQALLAALDDFDLEAVPAIADQLLDRLDELAAGDEQR